MSNLIQIKRSYAQAAPGSLADGELAYSFLSKALYVGNSSGGMEIIGGKTFIDRIDHTPGTLTATSAVITDANSHINQLNTTNFRIGSSGTSGYNVSAIVNTISGASANTQLVTAKAVYDFFTTQVQVTSINDLIDVISASPGEAQLLLYSVSAGAYQNQSITGDITINANGVVGITAGSILDSDISAAAGISRVKIAAGSANHVVINGSDGRLSSEASLAPSRGGTGLTATPTNGQILIGNSGSFALSSILGTANEVQVTSGAGSIQIGLPDDVTITSDLIVGDSITANSITVNGVATFGNNVSIAGNLTVTGTLTTLDAQNITVADPLIALARGNAADLLDIGLYGTYNDGTERFTGLFRDATDGKYRLFKNLVPVPTTEVNTGHVSYQRATLVADIESSSVAITGGSISGVTLSLSSALAVSSGGTGLTALTVNGVMYGSSTSAIGFATGTDGQVMQINGSGVPVFGTLDGGSY